MYPELIPDASYKQWITPLKQIKKYIHRDLACQMNVWCLYRFSWLTWFFFFNIYCSSSVWSKEANICLMHAQLMIRKHHFWLVQNVWSHHSIYLNLRFCLETSSSFWTHSIMSPIAVQQYLHSSWAYSCLICSADSQFDFGQRHH